MSLPVTIRVPDDLVEFLESGVSIIVGTRDASLCPEASRACGATVDATRSRVTLYLGTSVAERTLANVRDNGQMAITFSRPTDNQTVQIKGTCVDIRETGEDDDVILDAYGARFVEQLYLVGLPRALTSRLPGGPAWAFTIEISDIFAQTPGPGAGARLEAP